MFKHNRKKRYEELVAAGFMSFKALWLSTIPFAKHPAMSLIIRMRRRLQEKRIRESNRKGWSETKRQRIWNIRTKKCIFAGIGSPVRIIRPIGAHGKAKKIHSCYTGTMKGMNSLRCPVTPKNRRVHVQKMGRKPGCWTGAKYSSPGQGWPGNKVISTGTGQRWQNSIR